MEAYSHGQMKLADQTRYLCQMGVKSEIRPPWLDVNGAGLALSQVRYNTVLLFKVKWIWIARHKTVEAEEIGIRRTETRMIMIMGSGGGWLKEALGMDLHLHVALSLSLTLTLKRMSSQEMRVSNGGRSEDDEIANLGCVKH
jgi:hypothetical protein